MVKGPDSHEDVISDDTLFLPHRTDLNFVLAADDAFWFLRFLAPNTSNLSPSLCWIEGSYILIISQYKMVVTYFTKNKA